MKITSNGPTAPAPLAPAVSTPPASATAGTAAPASAGASPTAALLGTARAALQQMPEIDAAKVAQVREALERGEIRFDAGKLAQLIERYHGSHG